MSRQENYDARLPYFRLSGNASSDKRSQLFAAVGVSHVPCRHPAPIVWLAGP